MKVLITGGNGLLGQKIVSELCSSGQFSNDLVVTAPGPERHSYSNDYKYISMDITDEKSVKNVLEETEPEVIINTAAMTNVDLCETEKDRCMDINVEGLRNIVKIANPLNTHIIHLSTDFIFDGLDGPYDENAEPNPVSFYGQSKLQSEELLMDLAKSWSIVRTVLVYGVVPDMSRSNILLWVREKLSQEEKIRVVDDQWRTPTLAEDLASGCLLIASKKAKGIYNIAGNDMLTPYDMAIKTAEFFDLNTELIERVDSSTFTQPAKRPPKTGLLIDKAIQALGYTPHSFNDGLSLVAKQLQQLSIEN